METECAFRHIHHAVAPPSTDRIARDKIRSIRCEEHHRPFRSSAPPGRLSGISPRILSLRSSNRPWLRLARKNRARSH